MGRSGINWSAEFPRLIADLTGDGRADIVGFGIDGVWISLNDGRGGFRTPDFLTNDSLEQGQFGYNQGWRVAKHIRTLAKLGTPHPDIVGFGDDGVWTALG